MRMIPANGGATLPPKIEPVNEKVSSETSSQARPFTVALYRPASSPRPTLLKWQRNATPDHDYLLVQLPLGEPYRVVVDGCHSLDDRRGLPWPPGLASVLTVRAVASAESISTIGVCAYSDPTKDSLLIVPIARQPFEADLDGQPVDAIPCG